MKLFQTWLSLCWHSLLWPTGLLLIASFSSAHADVVLDQIAAVVNDGVVLESDIAAESNFVKQRARATRQTIPADVDLRKQILDQLIDREIQRQRAKSMGVDIDQGAVNRAIERVAAGNNMNSLEFRQSLQKEGFDFAYYRKNIAHELLVARLVKREVEESITVTEKEIDDYLAGDQSANEEDKQYNIFHILIAMPRSAPAANIASARVKAEQTVERLRAGADFAETAKGLSDGPFAQEGGDLGWREAGELPEFILLALPNLKTDGISSPIQTNDGFHILQLNNKRNGEGPVVSEEVRLRHIFIATESEADNTSARNTLSAVRERVVAGESFADLAAEYSEDPDSKNNGGELPWLEGGQMPRAMDNTAAELAAGQISQPFRTQFGWHIMEVLERRTGNSPDSRLRNEASLAIKENKFKLEVDRWQRTLREDSFVEVLQAQ